MSYVGSFLKKKNSYFDTDEEFWDAFLKEYKKDSELDVNSQITDGSNKFGDLLERVQRGVPAEHRGEIWLSISDSFDAHLDVLYWQLLHEHCPYERAINQDLGRTFPEIPMFKTDEVRKQLYNIMKAYSIYDSEVGYCQGLSFIAGLFIMQGIKEELVFTIFVRLMESYNLRTLFTPKMPGLMLLIYQFNAIFQTYIPALYFHFYRYNLSPMMYASQWFLTLFSYSFNVDLVFRIVDMILVEGPISVLLRFALVILKRHEDDLLGIEKFDSLMDFLKSEKFTQVNDVEQMIKEVTELKKVVSDNRLDQLKHEHLEDIKKREPAQREMEQLRETLKLLRKENKEQANKINEDKKIQQALTDEIILLKQLVKELQEDNEAVKMQVKDLRTILSQEEKIKGDDRLLSLQEELQFLKDKLRATQVELCQSRMQYNELETAYQLEQERWKKSKRRLSRKIQLNEDKSKRTSLMIDPPSTPATPTSMKPIELPSIRE
ncbi:RabGAP/TBC [Piromyces finnis]|uniref:RabGAP/TBC n=1 Tax=Piromyces finnis TaxID=1754191 RepID=A0A1Y1V413_9FUNG|nr:RabGAP/TBC [Piromyces finnis]|eukprot:ORX45991.1 RabGAP/TBC [Piromyces finnis]